MKVAQLLRRYVTRIRNERFGVCAHWVYISASIFAGTIRDRPISG